MSQQEAFIKQIDEGYAAAGKTIVLGAGMLGRECFKKARVQIPLKTLNRHGLIAGATGTGKTRTLQSLAGSLSENGIPVLLMDIKGDLSGIAKPGQELDFIKERQGKIGIPFVPEKYPVDFLSLSAEKGIRLRATVSEFGSILMSKILGLNDTQAGVMAVLFKYCDDQNLPLLDLKDLKKTLSYMTEEGKEEIENTYGYISTASTGSILRRILELEQQGASSFFGEPSFDVQDLVRFNDQGHGYISLLRLTDIQDKPKLFSSFMLFLLSQVYATFPEIGDVEKPKLVMFFDEAHVLFEEASKALLDRLETIVKLIRSKGIGIYFCTQSPTDIPNAILGQLGLKVQHALRAFTAKDRKAIKLSAENFPSSPFYQTDQELTQLGIGEALVTALSEKGVPAPLVHTLLAAPRSSMEALSDAEIAAIADASFLARKYDREIDVKSAYEMLNERIRKTKELAKQETEKKKTGFSLYDIINSSFGKQMGRTFIKEIALAFLALLGLSKRRRR